MAWKTGTITNATPDGALCDIIKGDAALLNSGTPPTGIRNWSFVENVPAGTGAGQSGSASYSVDVFKCAGSGNDANDAAVDFYVGISRGNGTTLLIWVAELYKSIAANPSDADRGKCARPTGRYNSTVTVPDGTNWTFDETYRTFYARTQSTLSTQVQTTLNTSGFTYAVKFTKSLLLLSTNVGTTNDSWYCGLLDSLTSVTDTMPLVLMSMGTTNSPQCYNSATNGAFSRLPGVTSANLASAGYSGSSGQNGVWNTCMYNWTFLKMGANAAGYVDKWQGGKAFASRIVVMHRTLLPAADTKYQYLGWLRGLIKPEVLTLYSNTGTINFLDTTTIGADADWTVVGKNPANGNLDAGFYIVTRAN